MFRINHDMKFFLQIRVLIFQQGIFVSRETYGVSSSNLPSYILSSTWFSINRPNSSTANQVSTAKLFILKSNYLKITVTFILLHSFYFTEQTKISTTTGGENSVVQMLGSLYACIENDYGVMSTRLYRAFRPRPGTFLLLKCCSCKACNLKLFIF